MTVRVPSFSILVPAYERAEALALTLGKLEPYASEDCEVVVVDDYSQSSEVRDAVRDFPFVRYIRAPKNLGVIGARNFGYGHLLGDIIINLDDDSYPVVGNFLERIKEKFQSDANIGIVGFNIRTPDGRLTWRLDSKLREVRAYVGCGNAWSRDLYQKVGGYSDLFFRQGEELEHCMRAIDAGFVIAPMPDLIVQHDQSPINRNIPKHNAHELANHLKRSVLSAPAIFLPEGVARWLILLFVRRKIINWRELWLELGHPNRGLRQAIARRSPISVHSFKKVRALNRAEKMNAATIRT
ncbi:glycosyltransferase family 2 protein [Caulobacter sp. X]|uniref:glycosyltransferase family 2 protein n=1 Tax=Caulobacter sp. X TaxID=2048901 RepID=UPI0013747189|nr:glycosyltransferase [Caulobacter sp. X]